MDTLPSSIRTCLWSHHSLSRCACSSPSVVEWATASTFGPFPLALTSLLSSPESRICTAARTPGPLDVTISWDVPSIHATCLLVRSFTMPRGEPLVAGWYHASCTFAMVHTTVVAPFSGRRTTFWTPWCMLITLAGVTCMSMLADIARSCKVFTSLSSWVPLVCRRRDRWVGTVVTWTCLVRSHPALSLLVVKASITPSPGGRLVSRDRVSAVSVVVVPPSSGSLI